MSSAECPRTHMQVYATWHIPSSMSNRHVRTPVSRCEPLDPGVASTRHIARSPATNVPPVARVPSRSRCRPGIGSEDPSHTLTMRHKPGGGRRPLAGRTIVTAKVDTRQCTAFRHRWSPFLQSRPVASAPGRSRRARSTLTLRTWVSIPPRTRRRYSRLLSCRPVLRRFLPRCHPTSASSTSLEQKRTASSSM